MGLDRVIAWLGSLITLLVAAAVVYGAVAFDLGLVLPESELQEGLPWPSFLPAWLLVASFLLALAVTVIQMPLLVVQRSRKRRLAQDLGARARDWLDGAVAQEAGATGLTLLRLTAFRAHARGPSAVELSWNPPLDEVDEVVVARSLAGFATAPGPPAGPDSSVSAAFARASAGEITPPLDCMISSSPPKPISFSRPATSSCNCSLSTTHGPAMRNRGLSRPTSKPHSFI